jgi:hypothetical protein
MHFGYGVRAAFDVDGQARQDWAEPGHNADNFLEFRRLKRLKLQENSSWSLWRNTPSPPPEARAEAAQRLAAASKQHEANKSAKDHEKKKHSSSKRRRRDSSTEDSSDGSSDESSPSRSPSPRRDRKSKGGDDASKGSLKPSEAGPSKVSAQAQEQLLAIDKEEADLFSLWIQSMKDEEEEIERRRVQYEEDSAVVGPSLPDDGTQAMGGKANYGGALLPGEGDRMAAYVQSGQRIPRRGEVGLSSDQISKFETLGYVMSGSRHSRMNAVRIRKENQIYSAEEKAALAMFNFEESKRKEEKILEDMKMLVAKTVGQ